MSNGRAVRLEILCQFHVFTRFCLFLTELRSLALATKCVAFLFLIFYVLHEWHAALLQLLETAQIAIAIVTDTARFSQQQCLKMTYLVLYKVCDRTAHQLRQCETCTLDAIARAPSVPRLASAHCAWARCAI